MPLLHKIVAVSLAIASLVLGIFSHFDSDWARKTEHVDGSYFRPYELCYNWGWLFEHGPRCPIIIWEYFFVATVIAAFCWSVGTLVAGILLRERSTKLLRGFDIVLHVFLGISLLTFGVLYIVSANEVKLVGEHLHEIEFGNPVKNNPREKEKMAAGAIAIFQALLYGIIAMVISRGRDP